MDKRYDTDASSEILLPRSKGAKDLPPLVRNPQKVSVITCQDTDSTNDRRSDMIHGKLLEKCYKVGMSDREAEVVTEMCTGDTNLMIGDRLFVTEKTVKFHITSIYSKIRAHGFDVTRRAQLILWATGV